MPESNPVVPSRPLPFCGMPEAAGRTVCDQPTLPTAMADLFVQQPLQPADQGDVWIAVAPATAAETTA